MRLNAENLADYLIVGIVMFSDTGGIGALLYLREARALELSGPKHQVFGSVRPRAKGGYRRYSYLLEQRNASLRLPRFKYGRYLGIRIRSSLVSLARPHPGPYRRTVKTNIALAVALTLNGRVEERPKKKCIFCAIPGKLSKEHVFPRWIEQYLTRRPVKAFHRIRRYTGKTNALGQADFDEFSGKLQRPGLPGSHALKVVCKPCNNVWMGNLQEKTKPILGPVIAGKWQTLTQEQKTTLASWATMTVMVGDLSELESSGITQEERSEFYKSRSPLDGWSVWIARYGGGYQINFFHWVLARSGNTRLTTIIVGNALLYVVSSGRSDVHGLADKFMADVPAARVWPIEKGLIEPNSNGPSFLADPQVQWLIHRPPQFVRKLLEARGSGVGDEASANGVKR